MPDINSFYPSQYLKAADLGGQERRVTIANLEAEKLGNETKPVLYFEGKDQGLVLNKTNANTISDDYGYNTEGWEGRDIILYPAKVEFQGKRVPAIRVRVPEQEEITTEDVPF